MVGSVGALAAAIVTAVYAVLVFLTLREMQQQRRVLQAQGEEMRQERLGATRPVLVFDGPMPEDYTFETPAIIVKNVGTGPAIDVVVEMNKHRRTVSDPQQLGTLMVGESKVARVGNLGWADITVNWQQIWPGGYAEATCKDVFGRRHTSRADLGYYPANANVFVATGELKLGSVAFDIVPGPDA